MSLAHEPSLLHALYKPIYHVGSHFPGHSVLAPRCDVTETETGFHVDCELPSLANRAAVHVAWLGSNVLIIYGEISKLDNATSESDSARLDGKGSEEAAAHKEIRTFPRLIVHERGTGPFQRSFSFAENVDKLAMTYSLQDGLLRVNIPKAIFDETPDRVYPQSSTG